VSARLIPSGRSAGITRESSLRWSAAVNRMDGLDVVESAPLRTGKMRFVQTELIGEVREDMLDADRSQRIHSCQATITAGSAPLMLSWTVEFLDWDVSNFVLFPGAVYEGNRFEVRHLAYPPRMPEENARNDAAIWITDIPRLERGSGQSALSLRVGEAAQPMCAIWSRRAQQAWLFHTPPFTLAGESAWLLEESDDRKTARLSIRTPGIRPWRYRPLQARAPSSDRARQVAAGQRLSLSVRVGVQECASAEDLFKHVFISTHSSRVGSARPLRRAFDAMADLVELKQWRQNWSPAHGLFLVEPLPGGAVPYQCGWIGGMLSAWALIQSSRADIRTLAAQHFRTALTAGMSPCGLFYGRQTALGQWIADYDVRPEPSWMSKWTLIRRQADALWAGLGIAAEMDRRQAYPPGFAHCDEALRKCASVLCDLWERNGQWGQFADQLTGRLVVGNSSGGALVPAALCLAAKRYSERRFAQVALRGAEQLYQAWTKRGVTCGGPADALMAPDSESAFALVRSFVSVAQFTRADLWWERAEAAAFQAASWVMTYDYPLPVQSEFGRLEMRTAGTVYANAQNKHSAPGICTASSGILASIAEAGGKAGLGDLAWSIAAAIPQFVSTAERPIRDPSGRRMPPGWINERVATSDWENNLGGIFYGSCWCEISLLLSRADFRVGT
jgi:hypothetical protein